jgi:hypothetical protein
VRRRDVARGGGAGEAHHRGGAAPRHGARSGAGCALEPNIIARRSCMQTCVAARSKRNKREMVLTAAQS